MTQRVYDKLFVGGDLSGIQKFLYNITSKKAAVSLKGRSASIVDDMQGYYRRAKNVVIDAGGVILPKDELYCSGGKFFFIARVGEERMAAVCRALDECLSECREEIWKEHRGQLGINISYVAFNEENDYFYVEGKYGEPPYEGMEKGPGQLWRVASAGFAQQKNQRFKEHILQNYDDFFGNGKALKMGAGYEVCAITGIEFDTVGMKKAEYTIPGTDKKEPITVLPSVKKQIEKGEQLSKDPRKGFKTFEQYATTDKGNEGNTYLAILRMDVDGLGKRFVKGFNSLAEYKTFSENLCKFFEKDVEEKLLPDKGYRDYMTVIYAGGDDLFVVGRWDKVIEFAKLVHNETAKRFSREGITISGGIAVVKPKFPIAKAAEMAGEAEDAAKQYRAEKNAFHLFGKTVTWDSEFEYVERYKNLFTRYISLYDKSYGFSKSILHKIMLYAEIADINKMHRQQGKPLNYSYMWHMSYYLTRFMEKWKAYDRERNEEKRRVKQELYEFCMNLRDEQLTKPRSLELMAVAARWAELTIKDINK